MWHTSQHAITETNTETNSTKTERPVGSITYIKKFLSLFFDRDLLIGGGGTTMAIAFPYLDTLKEIFQLLGAMLGLLLIYLSIRHKLLEIKKLKRDDRNSGTGKPQT